MHWVKKNIFVILFVFINMFIALYFFCTRNNPTVYDLSGHFASAKFFSQGYFHAYNDFQFLGFVQNLFYPPMQDIIITIISFFTSKNFATAGLVYISLLYFFYLVSISYLAKIIHNPLVQSTFLFLVTLWLLLDKNTGIGIGLSFFDLMQTGLSTQFLGTIFFLILMRKIIENKNYLQITIFLTLCILSHIFVGLLALAFVFGYVLKNKKYFYSLFIALGLSSVCWLPFIFYSKYVIKYAIYDNASSKLIILSLLCVVLFLLKRKYSVLLIGAFCIFILNAMG